MLANVEQAATRQETDLLPSVSYNRNAKEIRINLICTIENGQKKIYSPPSLIPQTNDSFSWTVIWTLVPGEGVNSATFRNLHLGDNLPAGCEAMVAQVSKEDCEWKVWCKNNVMDFCSCGYNIEATFVPKKGRRVKVKHDPTIVVSKDPIEPPIGGGGGYSAQ